MGILAVLSKRQISDNNVSNEYIKISKKEYDELMAIKQEYLTMKEKNND